MLCSTLCLVNRQIAKAFKDTDYPIPDSLNDVRTIRGWLIDIQERMRYNTKEVEAFYRMPMEFPYMHSVLFKRPVADLCRAINKYCSVSSDKQRLRR